MSKFPKNVGNFLPIGNQKGHEVNPKNREYARVRCHNQPKNPGGGETRSYLEVIVVRMKNLATCFQNKDVGGRRGKVRQSL